MREIHEIHRNANGHVDDVCNVVYDGFKIKFQIISLELYFLSNWISAVRSGLVNA